MQYKFNQKQFLCKITSFSKKSKREGLEICRDISVPCPK